MLGWDFGHIRGNIRGWVLIKILFKNLDNNKGAEVSIKWENKEFDAGDFRNMNCTGALRAFQSIKKIINE